MESSVMSMMKPAHASRPTVEAAEDAKPARRERKCGERRRVLAEEAFPGDTRALWQRMVTGKALVKSL